MLPFELEKGFWGKDERLLIHSVYLIDTPSEFSKVSLKAYKSHDAYNLFISSHVQVQLIHDFCFIKSQVLIKHFF